MQTFHGSLLFFLGVCVALLFHTNFVQRIIKSSGYDTYIPPGLLSIKVLVIWIHHFFCTNYVESNYLHQHYFFTKLIGWTIFLWTAVILGIRKKSTHILNSHELHEQSYPTSIKREYTTICWFFWNRKQLKFVYSMYILSLFFKSSSSNFALNSTYYLLTDRIQYR